MAHHVDHVFRDVTGWPFEGGVNPFTMSLVVYPLIVVGLLLSRSGRAGPRFWVSLAGGGALFILAIHVGPAAGDSVEDIPAQYASPLADVTALAILTLLVLALLAHCLYELRRANR